MPGAGPATNDRRRVEALARRLDPIFVGLAVLAGAIALGQVARGQTEALAVGVPLLLAALALAARWLPAAVRVTGIVVLVPVAGVVLLAEVVAAVLELRNGDPFQDPRPIAQAVADERAAGHADAVPPSKAWAYLAEPLVVDGVPTIPLSGIANAREVLCTEGGPWRSYRTDRLGFTNPDAVWNRPADVVLIGDSFTQGFCVAVEDSFAGRIRAVHPATVNLGGGANGPLIELATLVEFLPRTGGRVVLWFFFEANDFDNLLDEARQPTLRGYLERGYSQHLLGRMPAVQVAQRATSEVRMNEWFRGPTTGSRPPGEWLRFLKLGHLRNRLGWFREAAHPYDTIDGAAVAALLPVVAHRMAEEATATGTSLAMVYLPSRATFAGRGPHPLRPVALDAARAADIPVIEVTDAFRASDPLALYSAPRDWSHLTPAGNRVVADVVLGEIERRGWLGAAR